MKDDSPNSPNSVDALIELYKQHIDVSLIEANLRRTPDERVAELQRLLELAEELRRAGREVASP